MRSSTRRCARPCTRAVSTAAYGPCTRSCTPLPCAWLVHGREHVLYGRVHGYVHGRVHRCVYRRVLDRYTVVSAAVYGRCTHAHGRPCTRPVGGRVYGSVHVRVHGSVRGMYTFAYTRSCTRPVYGRVCSTYQVVYTCTRLWTRPWTRLLPPYIRAVKTAVYMGITAAVYTGRAYG